MKSNLKIDKDSPEKKKNIVQLVEELNAPDIDPDSDLKDLFYKEQVRKYRIKSTYFRNFSHPDFD